MAVNPVSGKVYVVEHRGAQRGALRRAGTSSRGHTRARAHSPRAGSPCSSARARSRRATSTSTSTTAPAARPSRTPRTRRASRCRPAWPSPRRQDALRRRARLEQGRRLSTPRRSRTTPSCPSAARPDRASPAAARPGSCSTSGASRLYVLDALRQLASPSSTRGSGAEVRARRHVQPRAGRACVNGRRFLYDASLSVEPRRLGLRELPRLRRLRQPGLGSRQSGRARSSTNPGPVHRAARPFPIGAIRTSTR